MAAVGTKAPPGVAVLRRISKTNFSYKVYQASVLLITFITYALYHAARKPPSVVKGVLHPTPAPAAASSSAAPLWSTSYIGYRFVDTRWIGGDGATGGSTTNNTLLRLASSHGDAAGGGWAPFDGAAGTVRLGELDMAFLVCYSLGMYFSGHIGDRVNLRLFLAAGMLGSGLFACAFGLGYWLNVHTFWFYLAAQMLAGACQSTGWPSVVSAVANWCNKSGRGLLMGVWNAHTSVGNIAGSLVAAAVLRYGWGWSFVVPGGMMLVGAAMVFLFLVVDPADVGHVSPNHDDDSDVSSAEEGANCEGAVAPVVVSSGDVESGTGADVDLTTTIATPAPAPAVGFWAAWSIPSVAAYAFALFFAKLVAYTFLDWLPFYLKTTPIAGRFLSDADAGTLSTLYDVGGVAGGILAGLLSDRLRGRALTAAGFMYLAVPALFLFRAYGHVSLVSTVALMIAMGVLINGPYALITTAVSADLGTHHSLRGNARVLATVTAIIDGTGSVGAAVGPMLTGLVSQVGWDAVFYMLMASALVSALLLTRIVAAEVMARVDAGTINERLLKQ